MDYLRLQGLRHNLALPRQIAHLLEQIAESLPRCKSVNSKAARQSVNRVYSQPTPFLASSRGYTNYLQCLSLKNQLASPPALPIYGPLIGHALCDAHWTPTRRCRRHCLSVLLSVCLPVCLTVNPHMEQFQAGQQPWINLWIFTTLYGDTSIELECCLAFHCQLFNLDAMASLSYYKF